MRKIAGLILVLCLIAPSIVSAEDCKKASTAYKKTSRIINSNPSDALMQLKKAAKLCQSSAALRYNIGIAYYQLGRHDDAEDSFEMALKINSDHAYSLNALAFLILSKQDGDSGRALSLAKRAVALEPGNKDFKDTLAKADELKYPPDLSMTVAYKDNNNNNIIDAGESASLIVKLTNNGRGHARAINVTPKLDKKLPGLSIESSKSVAEIRQGETAQLTFKITADEDALPTEALSITVNAEEMRGFDADSMKITLSTRAYDPPVLKVVDIGIADLNENGQIEPTEAVEITARVQNLGTGEARSVKARVNIGTDVYPLGDTKTEFDLGNMASGQFKDIKFSIYTSKRASSIPISVALIEERSKHNVNSPLDLAFNRPEKKAPAEIRLAAKGGAPGMAITASGGLSIDVDLPFNTNMSKPNAVAVVIGNKSYSDDLVPDVEFAGRDAAVVKQYLVKTLGFKEKNIIYLSNAVKSDFLKTFGDKGDHRGDLYSMMRKGKSDVFVFYSGHGAPDTNEGKAYLVPSEADTNSIKFTGYSLDVMYDNLTKIAKDKKAKSVTVVIDSCFSGSYNEGSLMKDASPMYLEVKMPMMSVKNSAVITSSSAKQISSWYREKKHGLFTYYFLKTIKDAAKSGKQLSIAGLEKALKDVDSVNDTAWNKYRRNQNPTVIGNKNLLLLK